MSGIERQKVGLLPIWGWAVCTGLAVWLLYVFTLAPTTGFWDTSEYIATAHIVGLPHPPGNPLFVLFGRVWLLLTGWTGLGVAFRINLMGATVSAAAAVFWFLAVVRIWTHFTDDRRELVVAGITAVLVGATAFTVWTQSNLNEKVYTVSLLIIAMVSYLAMLWEDESGTPRGDRILALIAFLLGLGASNHTMSLLPLPALALFVLWHDWRTALRLPAVGAAVALFLFGLTIQTVAVPIRSAQNPIIDEADPACESLVAAIATPLRTGPIVKRYTPESIGCEALRASMAREQYGKGKLSDRQAPIPAQFLNYWQYYDWQWGRSLSRVPRAMITMLFLFFTLVGLWQHWKGDRDSFVYFGALLATVTAVLVFYLNFKYGYSLFNEEVPSTAMHEVRERDYFYVASFYVLGLYAGLGIVTLWRMLAERVGEGVVANGYLRASPLLAAGLIPLVLNFGWADRRGDYAARDWAYNILQSVEPYAVLFTNGDNDTFPLWYLQEVEGIRRDVTVIVHSYLGTPWYPKQLRELTAPCPEGVDPMATPTVVVCQRPWDRENAVGPYRDMDPATPTRSIISLTDEQIDNLPAGYIADADTSFAISNWASALVRKDELITYPDILVLHIAQRAAGDRPVYFAATAPPVYSAWNLQPHLLRQGLAHKLVHAVLEPTADTVIVGMDFGVPWIDRKRSRELLWDVFQVAYLEDWDRWPEPSTASSIPAQYYIAYYALGAAEETVENMDEAERNYRRGQALIGLSDLLDDETDP